MTRDRFGKLSNMTGGLPIRAFGETIPSAEALYQALRFPHRPEIQDVIISAESTKAAKAAARLAIAKSRADWDAVRVPAMAWVLRLKLMSNPDRFGEALDASGTSEIVEESARDDFWGAIPRGPEELVGRNILGRLLSAERDAMRSTGIPRVEDVAPDFEGAILLGRSWAAETRDGGPGTQALLL